MTAKEAGTETLMQLSEQSLELVSVFKEARINFFIVFLLDSAVSKISNRFTYVQRALINLLRLKEYSYI
jgi:hypothetical protein